ncbi:MAG: glycosyltransferase [Candidatus Solibacter sp.]|jgi:1,2-diacylglycerol 3-beta-galactosyltransferase
MKVDFIFFDAGGGHRAAANALRQVMERQGSPFEIRMVNLQEVLDAMDVFRKVTGLRLQDIYNLMLKKGWTLGSPQLMVGMHWVIRLFHPKAVRLLETFWRERRPDMVVSLVPNLDRALGESVARALPGVPFVTILTDIADYPPHFWMERQVQHFICGSAKAVEQALAMGHAEDKVHRVSGMILNPWFYEIAPLSAEDRAAARARLGFDPAKPVGLVLFGGEGSAVMREIARLLPQRQLLLICGNNGKLRDKLQSLPHPAPVYVEGFTQEVPRYMQIADYFIGKPGPGSISEAVAMRLPAIVERNAWTLPQERYNAEWVREMGVGIVLPNFRGIARAVEELLAPAAFQRFREATGRLENRAVFEIPGILERIAKAGG